MSDGPALSQKTFDAIAMMKQAPATVFLVLAGVGLGIFIFALGIDEFGQVYRRNGWLFGLFAVIIGFVIYQGSKEMKTKMMAHELEMEKIRKPKTTT